MIQVLGFCLFLNLTPLIFGSFYGLWIPKLWQKLQKVSRWPYEKKDLDDHLTKITQWYGILGWWKILSIFIIWNVKLYIKGGGYLITWIIKWLTGKLSWGDVILSILIIWNVKLRSFPPPTPQCWLVILGKPPGWLITKHCLGNWRILNNYTPEV